MGDLDTCLINEFAKRPGFYDRTSPYFKDKIYTENAWKEIALELGYEVTMLKERMYQLRNRYNLEKRKLETMRADDMQHPKSTWTLFYHLTFLDGHIRPRKSYKSMMRKAYEEQEQNEMKLKNGIPIRRRGRPRKTNVVTYAEDGDDENNMPTTNGVGGNNGYANTNNYGSGVIKHEVMESDDDLNTNADETNFVNPVNLLAADNLNKLDTDSTQQSKTQQQQQQQQQQHHHHHHHQQINTDNINNQSRATTTTTTSSIRNTNNLNNSNINNTNNNNNNKRKHDETLTTDDDISYRKKDKFTAFGQFLAASLSELPEQKSLDLIEKFTVQLVSSMRSSSGSNGSGGGSGSSNNVE